MAAPRPGQDSMGSITAPATDGTRARMAAACASIAAAWFACAASAVPPARCASTVVSYVAGSGTGTSYRSPAAALGEPTRFTGVGVEPGAVTPFRPAFMPGEVVSVGRGGELVVAFDQPVFDDPANPYGIDLIVYGNSMCTDLAYPGGVAGPVFEEGGTIEVSPDGVQWSLVPGAVADGGLPTLGFMDIGPYSTVAGTVPTDPAVPVPPDVTGTSMMGLSWDELVVAYGGGAGGTRIDLASAGVTSARFVRIRVAATAASVPEIDAIVAVRPARLPGDLNGDGAVTGADLGILLGQWGPCAGCSGDLDGDGAVTGADLGMLLGGWR